jgi:hypothetical protein
MRKHNNRGINTSRDLFHFLKEMDTTVTKILMYKYLNNASNNSQKDIHLYHKFISKLHLDNGEDHTRINTS